MNTQQTPAKWPFPPVQQPRKSRSQKKAASGPAGASKKRGLTRGAMLADVVLVAVWGATIPGMMWLGAAGGF